MQKNQQKIKIIALIGIVMFFGIYYYSNKIRKPTPNQDIVSTLSEPIINNVEVPKNKENVSQTSDETKIKFNNTMDSARSAFGKGAYDDSIRYYNEALLYGKYDTVYSGLFVTYSAQNNIDQARIVIEKAISINPTYTDYWIWKISLLDEKTNVSYSDLKKIYEEAFKKVYIGTKINLVTSFAKVAEANNEKVDAVAQWKKAIELYPDNKDVYQAEIDRLNR